MGRAVTSSWLVAYEGLMPESFLSTLDAERSAQIWRERLSSGAAYQEGGLEGSVLVICDEHGRVVGMSVHGADRVDRQALTAELWAIYIAPENWQQGYGRLLLKATEADMRAQGSREAVLWVLRDNERAKGFYASMGWKPDGRSVLDASRGFAIEELRYRRVLASEPASRPGSVGQ